ncbi:MAG: UMP kinase [Planctomycetes bacterium]|nr:UMP kinase [Planctomycetota bacterium]
MRWKRVLLKLSGESLCEPGGHGIDLVAVRRAAELVKTAHVTGAQIAVVLGGGNIMRGAQIAPLGINRATADQMGMLATAINSMALQDALEKLGVPTRVCSGIDIREVMEPFIRRRAMRHLEKGRVVILSCGTGRPFFTTDTAAAVRAKELDCEVLLKATKVDGVYDSDPRKNPNAKRYARINYIDVITQGLEVMDKTAITTCMEHRLPIVVFDMSVQGNLVKVLSGAEVGTLVSD